MSEYQESESNWALHKIMHLKININSYLPISGVYYVDLPKDNLKDKEAVINTTSNDNQFCFLQAVVSALYPADKNVDRISSYPHYNNILDYNEI